MALIDCPVGSPMRKRKSVRTPEKGQAIILALFLILVGAGTAVILYNAGQTAAEKSRLVDAVDAAAYSGAIQTARNLNFMAYTNRAMIANTVVVGHVVSYVSWIRMVEDSVDKLEPLVQILNAIPYVGYILAEILDITLQIVDAVAPAFVELAEVGAQVLIPTIELTNQLMHAAQRAARLYLGNPVPGLPLYNVMNETAQEYNETIRVNDLDHLGDLVSSIGDGNPVSAAQTGAILTQITTDLVAINGFVSRYTAANDDGRIKDLTLDSLGPSEDWIEDRNTIYRAVIIPLPKTGSTELEMGDETDWEAEDKIAGGVFGEGEATATEFYDGYSGVPGYYDIADTSSPKDQILHLTAYATMPISEARIFRLLGMESASGQFAAMARAEIYHERPDPPLFSAVGEHGEYSNVFNPFWEVRLVEPGVERFFNRDSNSNSSSNSSSNSNSNSEGRPESTSASDESTSASDESTSASDESTSASDESTSASDESTSASDESTSASDESTSASDESTSASDESTPESDEDPPPRLIVN